MQVSKASTKRNISARFFFRSGTSIASLEMDACRHCGVSVPALGSQPPLCASCRFQLTATPCSLCHQRVGRVYSQLDAFPYCGLCVAPRAQELGVDMNPDALRTLALLTQLQEQLNDAHTTMQERVIMLNEDVTAYVHLRSEHCFGKLQAETVVAQQRYSHLMFRLQLFPMAPNDDDEEALEQVQVPGLLRKLNGLQLVRVSVKAQEVNRAMTQALMGGFVFFAEVVRLVEFTQMGEEERVLGC